MGAFRKPSPPAPPDPAVLTQNQGALNAETLALNARLNRPNQTSPFGNVMWNTDPSGTWWSQNTEYPQPVIDAYFANVDNQKRMSDMGGFIADAAKGSVRDANGNYKPFDVQSPELVGQVGSNQAIGELDTSGLQTLPGQNDFGAERRRVEEALYGRQTAALDPQFNKRQTDLETQLTNQGFARGSEGWNNAAAALAGEREKAYAGARTDAITGGGSEQSRLFGDALAARGQGFGEALNKGQFYNQGAQQDFAQRFQSGQFQDAARSQKFQEELQKRNQPFSEFMQLVHGAAPNIPQFSNPTQIAGAQAPDYMGAALGNYAGQMNSYNAQAGGRNNLIGTLGKIGSGLGLGK